MDVSGQRAVDSGNTSPTAPGAVFKKSCAEQNPPNGRQPVLRWSRTRLGRSLETLIGDNATVNARRNPRCRLGGTPAGRERRRPLGAANSLTCFERADTEGFEGRHLSFSAKANEIWSLTRTAR